MSSLPRHRARANCSLLTANSGVLRPLSSPESGPRSSTSQPRRRRLASSDRPSPFGERVRVRGECRRVCLTSRRHVAYYCYARQAVRGDSGVVRRHLRNHSPDAEIDKAIPNWPIG